MGNNVCIGLFGTCGNSTWRDKFIEKYEQQGYNYYNPNKADWKPEYAVEEAEHLANDKIILFPVTKETYGTGSLSEVGFSVLNAIRLDDRRNFVVMIEQDLSPELNDPIAKKESLRARALVKEHLKKLRLDNLYVVESLEDMLSVSENLYLSELMKEGLERFNPHRQQEFQDNTKKALQTMSSFVDVKALVSDNNIDRTKETKDDKKPPIEL